MTGLVMGREDQSEEATMASFFKTKELVGATVALVVHVSKWQ